MQAIKQEYSSGQNFDPILDLDAAEAGLPQPKEAPAARSDLLWVVDFPMFELESEAGGDTPFPLYSSSHHPFTAPAPQDIEKLQHAAQIVRTVPYRAPTFHRGWGVDCGLWFPCCCQMTLDSNAIPIPIQMLMPVPMPMPMPMPMPNVKCQCHANPNVMTLLA